MNRVRQQLYVFILFVISSCFLHANQDNRSSKIRCALACLQDLKCGWIVLDRDICHTNTSINCTGVDNERFLIYRREYSGLQIEGCLRQNEFALINSADTCTTSTSCDTPPSVSNADVNYSTLFPGSRARYTCKDGFSFCGRPYSEVECLSNGSWEEQGGCIQDRWGVGPAYNGTLNCPLTAGTVIQFIGIPTENTKHLSFNLARVDWTYVVHLDVRFHTIGDHEVVANSQTSGGTWQTQLVYDTFPFQYGKQFNMTVTVNTTHFDFLVDSVYLYSFPQRHPLAEVGCFKVEEFCEVISIKFKYNSV